MRTAFCELTKHRKCWKAEEKVGPLAVGVLNLLNLLTELVSLALKRFKGKKSIKDKYIQTHQNNLYTNMHLSLLTPTRGKHGALAIKQNQTRIMPYKQGAYFFNLIPTKLRIIPHIKETNKTPCPNPSITLSCLQLFRQEMYSHSRSSTFFISIPAHEKWYHFTLQCKLYLSHPIVFSSRFGRPQGRRKSSPESSSDSITCIGKQSTLLP